MAGPITSDPVDLAMTAGLPYRRRFRVTGAAVVWPTVPDFEVRSQIRAGKDETTELLYNLAQHITPSIDVDDIVLDLELTGAQTRLVPHKGYYDMIISDPGVTDARAIPVSYGKIKVGLLVTAAVDV